MYHSGGWLASSQNLHETSLPSRREKTNELLKSQKVTLDINTSFIGEKLACPLLLLTGVCLLSQSVNIKRKRMIEIFIIFLEKRHT